MDANKYKIKKWQWALYIIVSAGLLLITESWLMSLGIMLLLILLDRIVADVNRSMPSYSKLAKIEVVDQPFEKTPKMSIKRFLYK